jgi:hypothetical protein
MPAQSIIVTGLGQSGTSLVAAMADCLGITFPGPFVPSQTWHPNGSYENRELEGGIKNGNALPIIGFLSQFPPGTGFKHPELVYHLEALTLFCRNTKLIFCVRPDEDIAAARKKRKLRPMDRETTVRRGIISRYCLRGDALPVHVVDFRRIFEHPEGTVESIANFCEIPIVGRDIAKAASLVQPELRSA